MVAVSQSETEQVSLQGPSRLSYTNSSNSENTPEKTSRRKSLTERQNVTLRTDVRDFTTFTADRPVTWERAKTNFLDYDEDARQTENVFKNTETGETAKSAVSHRFQPEYREQWYAKFNDCLRTAHDRWSVVHTTMLGLTASSTPDYVDGQQAPVDHWTDCDASNSAVKDALRRIKNKYGAVAIEFVESHPGGGTNDGYLHKHPVILSPVEIADEDLQKVLNAHVNNAPNAEHDAHSLERSVTQNRVKSRKDPDGTTDEVIENLPAYLAGYLLDYGESIEDLPEPQLAGAAIMWATGSQSVRPGSKANDWMSLDEDDKNEESAWTLEGVEKDGEFYPASDDPDRGGVDTFTTSWDPPD